MLEKKLECLPNDGRGLRGEFFFNSAVLSLPSPLLVVVFCKT